VGTTSQLDEVLARLLEHASEVLKEPSKLAILHLLVADRQFTKSLLEPSGLLEDDNYDDDEAQSDGAGVALEDVVAALRVEQEAVYPGVPVDFLTDSLTPTALVEEAGSQVLGLAWLAPEGGFDAWVGGGSKGTNNMRRLNVAWDGGNLREKVSGRKRNAERACLSMGVMLHEEAAADVLRNPEMRARGYSYRFLVLVPERRIGGNVGPFDRIPHRVAERYRRSLWSMMALPAFCDEARTSPRRVRLSAGACEAYWEFFNPLQQRIQEGRDLHELHGWVEKMCQSTIRIAGLLHLAEHAPSLGARGYDLPVHRSSMEKAVCIGAYLIPHARLAYGDGAVPGTAGSEPAGVHAVGGRATPPLPSRVTLVDAICQLVGAEGLWDGYAKALYERLTGLVPEELRASGWPGGESVITRYVKRDQALLRSRGVVPFTSRDEGGGRIRLVPTTQPTQPSGPSEPSGPS